MAYEDLGHFIEVAFQAAFFLDIAELLEGFLELAGEASAVESGGGQKRDLGLGGWGYW